MYDPQYQTEAKVSLHDGNTALQAMHGRVAAIRKWLVIGALVLMGFIAVVFFFTGVPLPYIGIVAGVFALSVWVIDLAVQWHQRNRVLYQSLLPVLLSRIEQENDVSFSYEYRPALDKSFNERMGLFTHYASIRTMYEILMHRDDGMDVTILQCSMTTSNGKSATTHFSGVYAMFPIAGYPVQQLRTSGSPALKKTKFLRLKEEEDKLYMLEDHPNERIDSTLRQILDSAKQAFTLRGTYLASNKEEVHLGLWFKKIPSLPKEWNQASLRPILDWYRDLFLFLNTAAEQLEVTR